MSDDTSMSLALARHKIYKFRASTTTTTRCLLHAAFCVINGKIYLFGTIRKKLVERKTLRQGDAVQFPLLAIPLGFYLRLSFLIVALSI